MARELVRIHRIPDLIKGIWLHHPDMRYAQLNAMLYHECNPKVDPFYVEDDQFEAFLWTKLKQLMNGEKEGP